MKFALAFFALAIVIAIANARSGKKHSPKWEAYKAKHEKKYKSDQEDETRKAKFLALDAEIEEHNKLHDNGEVTYRREHNHLSDKSKEEINRLMGARNQDPQPVVVRSKRGIQTQGFRYNTTSPIFHFFVSDSNYTSPSSVDLRKTGWNEPVRNQGNCGSCWTFSTSTAMSHYIFKKKNATYVFSTQDLVDCAVIWGAGGCDGGSPAQAMEYIMMQYQTLEANYIYKAIEKACVRASTVPLYGATGFVQIYQNKASLEQALARLGVAVVSIHADGLSSYSSGVWDGTYKVNRVLTKCDATKINHAVAAIGYGTDAATGKAYWLIKNSWGTGWGEQGYFRMLRSTENLCGIFTYAYALV